MCGAEGRGGEGCQELIAGNVTRVPKVVKLFCLSRIWRLHFGYGVCGLVEIHRLCDEMEVVCLALDVTFVAFGIPANLGWPLKHEDYYPRIGSSALPLLVTLGGFSLSFHSKLVFSCCFSRA